MYNQKYVSKFRNVRQEYNGVRYDSKLEASYAMELDLQMKASNKSDRVKNWDRQFKIQINVAWGKKGVAYLTDEDGLSLKAKGIRFFHICNYYIDFVVEYCDGTIKYVEVKGFVTPVWQLKWKLTEAIFNIMHPEIELEVVK